MKENTKATDATATDATSDNSVEVEVWRKKNRDPLLFLPPLTYVTVLAAFSSMLINRLIIPALSDLIEHRIILSIVYYGQFAINLTGTAGLFALTVSLVRYIRCPLYTSMLQRLATACLAGIFLPTIFISAFFSRDHTTIHIVLLGVAVANILIVIISINGFRFARTVLGRVLIAAIVSMAVFALASQVFQLVMSRHLDTWHLTVVMLLRGIGEFSYLVLLLSIAVFILPRGTSLRDQFARYAAVVIFGVSFYGYSYAQRHLGSDFTLILYHAQRVSCLIETVPIVYALPLSLSLAASLSTIIGKDYLRAHAGIGVLLLLSAGYAPRVPERLLTITLAMTLIVFAAMAINNRKSQALS